MKGADSSRHPFPAGNSQHNFVVERKEMTDRRIPMTEAQTRVTLTRSRDGKWMVHIDGIRNPGMTTTEVLTLVQGLLARPENLASVMIETRDSDQ